MIRPMITVISLLKASSRAWTGVAAGEPSCQGRGSAARAAASAQRQRSSRAPAPTAPRSSALGRQPRRSHHAPVARDLFTRRPGGSRRRTRAILSERRRRPRSTGPGSVPPSLEHQPHAAKQRRAYTIASARHNRPNLLRQAAAATLRPVLRPASRAQSRLPLAPAGDHIEGSIKGAADDQSRRHQRIVLRADRHGARPGRGDRRRGARRNGRRRIVPRIQPVGERRARRRPHQERGFDTTQGFGLRAVSGEAAGYAHASELSEAAIRRAAATVRAVASGHAGTWPGRRRAPTAPLYRVKPAGHRRSRRQDQASRRDRRLCARQRPARQAGHGLAVAGYGRRCRSCGPTAAGRPTSARWCGSTSRSSSARATAWKPAHTAPAAG